MIIDVVGTQWEENLFRAFLSSGGNLLGSSDWVLAYTEYAAEMGYKVHDMNDEAILISIDIEDECEALAFVIAHGER
jgi:hypothetical protein